MIEDLFEGVGEKIKVVSKVLFWLGCIVCVVLAVVMFYMAGEENEGIYSVYGLLFLIVGPVCVYVSSLFYYAFGIITQRLEDADLSKLVNEGTLTSNSQQNKTTYNDTLPEL